MSLCPICHLRAVQNIEKTEWLPATKENLVVVDFNTPRKDKKWYWINDTTEKKMPLYGPLTPYLIEGGIVYFTDINSLPGKFRLSKVKIQPAPAPPDMED